MTGAPEEAIPQAQADTQAAPEAGDWGWYLYGIIRCGPEQPVPMLDCGVLEGEAGPAIDSGVDVYERFPAEPVQMLECGALAAIVRPVPLAEFGDEAQRAHGDDTAWLEAMVRGHNQVIASIHQQRAILPAKFGSVYARAEDVKTAVAEAHDALLVQLGRVEGCDEWAVHVYADRPAIQQRVVAEHPSVQQLQQELADARPGRAYFLQRKLADELAAATEQALSDLAQDAYDRLARRAVAGQVGQPARSTHDAHGATEILRAAFLVRRASTDAFLVEIRSFAEGWEGVRCEYSGPWPPYSFAVLAEEESP